MPSNKELQEEVKALKAKLETATIELKEAKSSDKGSNKLLSERTKELESIREENKTLKKELNKLALQVEHSEGDGQPLEDRVWELMLTSGFSTLYDPVRIAKNDDPRIVQSHVRRIMRMADYAKDSVINILSETKSPIDELINNSKDNNSAEKSTDPLSDIS